ncbi:MAG TPA: endonuclease/exonuclease/phosphatase family protein [candidate division Zixibacteria bacterium]|nr:endonuclease/exonuclease/phosphatase family protein [candidate division Zixibacteria bacterium]
MPLPVLSYNIHECVGRDRRRDPARIAEVIRQSGAEVVGLQEVHSEHNGRNELHQMNYLAEATGLQAIPGPSVERRNGHYGNALLTKHRVLSFQRIDLSVPGREPRGAIDADLEIGGEPVRFVVTHLGLNPAERRCQVQKLLAALSRERARTVVLLSDFNEWLPIGRSLRWLHARLGKTSPLCTFPARFPILPLDRIWVCPSSALLDLSIFDSPLARIASDHLPLKARVRIAEAHPAP